MWQNAQMCKAKHWQEEKLKIIYDIGTISHNVEMRSDHIYLLYVTNRPCCAVWKDCSGFNIFRNRLQASSGFPKLKKEQR